MKIGFYAGSFDPITNGHIDIIKQSEDIFDRVIIAIMRNNSKTKCLLDYSERLLIIKEVFRNSPNITVIEATGPTVDIALLNGATHLIRGIRNGYDLENELVMRQINMKLSDKRLNTVFLTTDTENQIISSSLIRELISLNKPIDDYTDHTVVKVLKLHDK